MVSLIGYLHPELTITGVHWVDGIIFIISVLFWSISVTYYEYKELNRQSRITSKMISIAFGSSIEREKNKST